MEFVNLLSVSFLKAYYILFSIIIEIPLKN